MTTSDPTSCSLKIWINSSQWNLSPQSRSSQRSSTILTSCRQSRPRNGGTKSCNSRKQISWIRLSNTRFRMSRFKKCSLSNKSTYTTFLDYMPLNQETTCARSSNTSTWLSPWKRAWDMSSKTFWRGSRRSSHHRSIILQRRSLPLWRTKGVHTTSLKPTFKSHPFKSIFFMRNVNFRPP